MEFASLAAIVDFDRTPPGTKLVLRNVRVVRGWMLLTPECVQVHRWNRVEALGQSV
jgi:hypothetical protein